jgi:hypothetical protein
MRIIKGVYRRDIDKHDIKLYVMDEKETSLAGIDLTLLTEDEIDALRKAVNEYNEKLQPIMKNSYRRFSKEKFISLEEVEV